MKWFLSVYYDNYCQDITAPRSRSGALREPDRLSLEPIRLLFERAIWTNGDNYDKWVQHLQQRRNASHAYRDREFRTFKEFEHDVCIYLDFVQDLDSRVPYPDDCCGS